MIKISLTELEQNIDKYIGLSQTEDIIIESNGDILTMLSNPKKDNYDEFLSLRGILKGKIPNDDYKAILDERELNR